MNDQVNAIIDACHEIDSSLIIEQVNVYEDENRQYAFIIEITTLEEIKCRSCGMRGCMEDCVESE